VLADFDGTLARARAGEADALGEIYADLVRPVAAYLRVRGAHEVDDLTSEVFVAVLRGVRRFRGDERAFRSWVFTIAHHRAVDSWRQRARTLPVEPLDDLDAGPSAASAEEHALESLGSARVTALLASLTEDQRDVLTLRLVADLTVEQVAEVTGKQVGAVKALQRRGLAALRRALERQGVPL
jgi:RNA polymerase sigma-70 factor (ECF subfamily)